MMYLAYTLLTLHMFVGIFLIGLILLQRGRGGGLAGSFGGMGGQSAFGTKAGDIFTRITIVVALIWIVLACVCILVVSGATKGRFKPGAADAVIKAPVDDKGGGMGAGEADPADKDAVVLPAPGKAEAPAGDEPKPEVKKDDAAADAKKPAEAEAKPDAAKPDAAADAAKKDNEKPATPEKPESKPE